MVLVYYQLHNCIQKSLPILQLIIFIFMNPSCRSMWPINLALLLSGCDKNLRFFHSPKFLSLSQRWYFINSWWFEIVWWLSLISGKRLRFFRGEQNTVRITNFLIFIWITIILKFVTYSLLNLLIAGRKNTVNINNLITHLKDI